MSYFTRLDVANRALQHLGVPRIAAFTDSSRQAKETNFAVDKLRRAELQRSVWTFATRRASMRARVSTSKDVTFVAYASGTTYGAGDVVKDTNSFLWLSRKASNLGNITGGEGFDPFWVPYHGPMIAQAHDTALQYIPGDVVYVSTAAYLCIAVNTNQLPPNTTYWRAVTGATVAATVTLSPIGYEKDATTLRNVFRLPANWLRMAPQDPKMASGVRQNMTAGMAYNDWEVEEPFMFTNDGAGPFVLRFVADQTDVSTMHPLFCEVWAARMSIELAPSLTQSEDKLNDAIGIYQRYMDMAQSLNAVESGTTEEEPRLAGATQPQGRQGQQGQQG